MKLTEHKPEPPPSIYTLELTKEELANLALLSYRHEIGYSERFTGRMPNEITAEVARLDREERRREGNTSRHTWIGSWSS